MGREIEEKNRIQAERENTAALAIQFRFRLRKQGLLKYWMWDLPKLVIESKDSNSDAVLLNDESQAKKDTNFWDDPADFEVCNDGHGGIYYYNIATGQSQWEKPKFNPTLGDAPEIREGPGYEENKYSEEKQNVEDWELVDDGEGRVYYFNVKTQD